MAGEVVDFVDPWGNPVKCSGCGSSRGVLVEDRNLGDRLAKSLQMWPEFTVRGIYPCCPYSAWFEWRVEYLEAAGGAVTEPEPLGRIRSRQKGHGFATESQQSSRPDRA